MNQRPLLSVCIPAYNRAGFLAPLLESILSQDFDNFEVLICEDGSPERMAIQGIVLQHQRAYPGRIRYEENATNLGYDGNIRRLIEAARGHYCFFVGNDDLLCAGALTSMAESIQRQPDCGVVVRTYASFIGEPEKLKQVFRYFPQEYVLSAGAEAVFTAYRRSVVISGLVIHRDAALEVQTQRFDGTLLYQLYLVGMILAKRSVVFNPHLVALRREGTPPDFGNSVSEREKFIPHDQTPQSSIHFMQGMLEIAKHIGSTTNLDVFPAIRADIGNYSYPVLAIQATRPLRVFACYGFALAKLGLWRAPLFYLYFITLLFIGPGLADYIISRIKSHLGYTPRFGSAKGKSK